MKFICGDRSLDLSEPQVMGILNATPDSFSDGGQFNTIERAMNHARTMVEQGAGIIDVGGESTRPGAKAVSVQQELDRVIPVIERIRSELDVCISVDSSTPEVFLAAKEAGAHMLNDVRALQREGALLAAKETGLPVCLMHMQGEPDSMQDNPVYQQIVEDVYDFLFERIRACEEIGIGRDQILLDPGFGFGKTLDDNYALLAHLDRFNDLNLPLLIGLSRKSMIAGVLNQAPVDERVMGSVAGAVIAAMKGAKIIRVHDVKETAQALKVVQATKAQL